ncbi:ABC1 kinase family protein [Streptomyces indicus]|uniref:Ubiquinone biosynthesis protein n=1 Tax=Streptomyces indicus TaxID=417292 RepID=A0A1G8US00_9ACTN|nr:AarF/UbiB family protein [Streptomyces indicus]SDJ55855.1 ubiquinone biosynthesis protein [Streptomyces indicus]
MTHGRSFKVGQLMTLLVADVLTSRERIGVEHTELARRQRRARRIREVIEHLGPFWVKVGQILATRSDVVSDAVLAQLAGLQDSVHSEPFPVFEPVLRQQLGPRWAATFREIDTEAPLGSASLAQVYRVVLADGRDGVLKVMRPGTRERVYADMAYLRRGARLAGHAVPRIGSVLDVEATLQVIFDCMQPELDFTTEAKHMAQGRRMARDFKGIHIPEVYLATPEVLLQSTARGTALNQTDLSEFSARQRRRIGRDLLTFMYRGYFVERMFHADPHPGNIFVHPEHGATLIDWGMVGRIDRNLGSLGIMALTSLAQNDARGLASAWTEMGRATPFADLLGFQEDMTRLVPLITAAALEDLDFGVALTQVLRCAAQRGIRTSPMVGMLGKSITNIEGSVRLVAPELSALDVFEDALTDVMVELARDVLSREQAARRALELILAANSTFDQLRSTLRDLANRELTMRIGLLPGHGIGSDSNGILTRRVAPVVAGGLAVWGVRRLTGPPRSG